MKFDRRTVIGKRFKCDTKEGKKCQPEVTKEWFCGEGSRCKYCGRNMLKPMGRK
jgi:hypothetical protein